MIEYHGWITLRESFSATDESGTSFEEALSLIKETLLESELGNGLVDIRSVNGMEHVTLSGFHNHENGTLNELLQFYRYVAEKAIGSYGLLYIHDDEDTKGEDNDFQVYVLAKGKLEKKKDLLLSPYVPTVEE